MMQRMLKGNINNDSDQVREFFTAYLQGAHWEQCSECNVGYLCESNQCGWHGNYLVHRQAGKPLCRRMLLLDKIDDLYSDIVQGMTFTKDSGYWARRAASCAIEYIRLRDGIHQ